jgi:hypothetical protein
MEKGGVGRLCTRCIAAELPRNFLCTPLRRPWPGAGAARSMRSNCQEAGHRGGRAATARSALDAYRYQCNVRELQRCAVIVEYTRPFSLIVAAGELLKSLAHSAYQQRYRCYHALTILYAVPPRNSQSDHLWRCCKRYALAHRGELARCRDVIVDWGRAKCQQEVSLRRAGASPTRSCQAMRHGYWVHGLVSVTCYHNSSAGLLRGAARLHHRHTLSECCSGVHARTPACVQRQFVQNLP